MKTGKLFTAMEKGIHTVVKVFSFISATAVALMICMVMANVVTRFLFKKPIPGTIECVQLIAVIAVFMAVSYTETKYGQVVIDLVVTHFPQSIRGKLASVMHLICCVFFIVLAWRAVLLAYSYLSPIVRATFILHIPFAPFMLVIALGSLALALECFLHIFHPLPPVEGAALEEIK
jgi:TRAP-type C4-dicarboxylate transport system permease small subunit